LISLEGISKSFGGISVLEPTTLTVTGERTLVLIGPSGSGKSTLLRLIVGLIRPDAGKITIDGVELTPQTIRGLRERMGYVIQDGGLFPHLTAARNVTLMAEHLGWERARIRDRLDDLARLTNLPVEMLGRYPRGLSGGQRQRVGLMRALMLDPAFLLMDEPLGALDPFIRARLQEELRGIFARLKKTVLLVTHDLSEAAYLGDEIVLIRDGRIVQRGGIRDLIERPAEPFVGEFVRAQRALTSEDEGSGR
jgi:osmoprotectant transport system ATP-binding protein